MAKKELDRVQKLNKHIKSASIAAFVVGGLTFLLALFLSMPEMLIDVVLIVVLGIFILKKKSRVAASVLFVYYLFNIIVNVSNGRGPGLAILFLIIFGFGVYATFAYHKEVAGALTKAPADQGDNNMFR